MTALQTRPAPTRPAATRPSVPTTRPTLGPTAATAAAAAASPCDCHYCDAVLPLGRTINFCPHCGQDLTVRQCPACSAEVKLGWSFCVCCGRGVGG